MSPGKSVALWLGAAALSGLLFALSTGIGPFGWLAWAAPLPVLLYAVHARSLWASAAAALVAYLIGEGGLAYAYHTLIPLPVLIISILIPAAAFAGVVAISWWAVRKLPGWVAVFSYPLLWTSWEFLLGLVSPHGSAGALGYTQTSFLHVVQIASLTGVWGVSFVTALPAMAIAVASKGRSTIAPALIPAAGVLLLVFAYGALRLNTPTGETREVALAAVPVSSLHQDEISDRENSLAAARAYAEAIRLVGPPRDGQPLTVVIPEKAITTFPEWAEEVGAVLTDAARSARVTLVVGIDEHRADGARANMAYVIGPDGGELLAYQKRHLVPGLEREFTPGEGIGVMGDEGVAICKDMDFPELLRAYGRADVRLLIAPAWDFILDARPHANMAIMRGVENGFSLARVAQEGLLTLTDARGRVLSSAQASADRAVWVRGELPLGDGTTPYARWGDVFGWIVVALTVFLLAALTARSILKPR